MENNIFKNAKFGDKFVTDFGIVLFVEKENDHYLLLQDSAEFRAHKKNNAFLNYDADGKAHCRNRGWDIISKYKEEVDEMTLRNKAWKWTEFVKDDNIMIKTIALECAMIGYRKAKEGE